MSMATPKNKGKGIGDTTSFTIPEKFNHVDTGEVIPVSAKMLQFINDNIEKRNLVHAIMTAIFNQTHGNISKESVDLQRVEHKIDEILKKINEGKVSVEIDDSLEISKNVVKESSEEATQEDLDDILNFAAMD